MRPVKAQVSRLIYKNKDLENPHLLKWNLSNVVLKNMFVYMHDRMGTLSKLGGLHIAERKPNRSACSFVWLIADTKFVCTRRSQIAKWNPSYHKPEWAILETMPTIIVMLILIHQHGSCLTVPHDCCYCTLSYTSLKANREKCANIAAEGGVALSLMDFLDKY